jgi:hypothetical protein
MHEFAVILILDVDDAPAILAATNRLAIDDNIALRPNCSKGNDILWFEDLRMRLQQISAFETYADGLVQLNLLLVVFVRVKRIQANVMVSRFLTNLHTAVTKRVKSSMRCVQLTFDLNISLSSSDKLSDFAITGTTLTTSLSFFMTMTSIGRSEWPVGLMRYRQQ